MKIPTVDPYGVRTPTPTTWPQYPYESAPRTPEQSEPRYSPQLDWNQSIELRDGVRLLLDVYRPDRPGQKFPALVSFSPYTRQLQREHNPYLQNEGGIWEFWVSRGYAHVIVDVRGSNGSGGAWDWYGPDEQRDYAEVIEWVARQPWCNGSVGMTGCSYFAVSQNLAAAQQPPSLKAIFPYDCQTDLYRQIVFPGGIPHDGYARIWFTNLQVLNFGSGRGQNTAAMSQRFREILGLEQTLDGPYFRERSTWPVLDRIQIPAYFGCHWKFYQHIRGPFSAWHGTGDIVKRMLIGPPPEPVRPFAAYHMEALRWYDHFLKGLDSGVLEGGPIHLWIPGDDTWREEREWPLARTRWTELYLGGGSANPGSLTDVPPVDGEGRIEYDPASPRWIWGEPRLVYRSEPCEQATELTGPAQLNLVMASTAVDTDWIAVLQDEGPDGAVREVSRGWLRSSHWAVDVSRSRVNQPWHPHEQTEPLTPGEATELQIELMPACNVFQPGHRVRLELSNCESLIETNSWYKRTLPVAATNSVFHGRGGSRIVLPVIPR